MSHCSHTLHLPPARTRAQYTDGVMGGGRLLNRIEGHYGLGMLFFHPNYLVSNLLHPADIGNTIASDVGRAREELMLFLGQEHELGVIQHLHKFIALSKVRSCPKPSHWRWYHRKYKALASPLYRQGVISKVEYDGYFWMGIPSRLKRHLHVTLQASDPLHDDHQPYPIQHVHAAAMLYFADVATLRDRLQIVRSRSQSPMSITTSTGGED